MKRKHKTSFISLATTIAILAGSVTLTSSAADTDTGYEIYTHVSGGSQPYEICTSSAVWLGGGKNTHANGSTTDAKSLKLSLFAIEDGKYYDITEAKSTKWALASSWAELDRTSGKIVHSADDDGALSAKISKGVVTAGKVSTNGGYVYAYAFPNVHIDPATKLYSSGAPQEVKIKVKEAPEVINFSYYTTSTGESHSWDFIKKVYIPYGRSETVAARGEIKDRSETNPGMPAEVYYRPAIDEDCTYTVSVKESDRDCISFSYCLQYNEKNYRADASSPYTTHATGLTHENLRAIEISADGVKKDSNTKASLIVTNEQSGKKATLAVNILLNPVGAYPSDMVFPAGSPLKPVSETRTTTKGETYTETMIYASLSGSNGKAGFSATEVDITNSAWIEGGSTFLEENIAPKQKPKIYVTEGYPKYDVDYYYYDSQESWDHNRFIPADTYCTYAPVFHALGTKDGTPKYSGLKVTYKCGRDANGRPKATLTFSHSQMKVDDIPDRVYVTMHWPDVFTFETFEVLLRT